MEFIHKTTEEFKGLEALAKEIFDQVKDERIFADNLSLINVEPTSEYEGLIAAQQDGIFKGVLSYSLTDKKTLNGLQKHMKWYLGTDEVINEKGKRVSKITEKSTRIDLSGAQGLRNYPFEKPLAFVWGFEEFQEPTLLDKHQPLELSGESFLDLMAEHKNKQYGVCLQLLNYLKELPSISGAFVVDSYREGLLKEAGFIETGLHVIADMGIKIDGIYVRKDDGATEKSVLNPANVTCKTKYPVMVWLKDENY